LKLGRVYRDMLEQRPGMSNCDLGEILSASEGSVRNQLLYPLAWDLLREKGERALNARREPIEPECYSFRMAAYTEAMVAKMAVRKIRALVASLQDLTEADEGESEQPPPAEPEARILARLKRAWTKATEDERQAFLEWTGVTQKIDELFARQQDLIIEARAEGRNEGIEKGIELGRARAEKAEKRVEPDEGSVQPEPRSNDSAAWLQATYAGEHTLARRILDFIRDQPDVVSRSTIVEACGSPPQAVQRALDKLKVAGFVRKSGYGRYIITDAGQDALSAEPEQGHRPVAKPRPGRHKPVDKAAPRNSYATRGARIREARIARNLSQRDLAEKVDANPRSVSMAECGKTNPNGSPVAGKPIYAKLEAKLGLETML
jgi:DNA-binding XRE family transcriptional regulator